MGSVHSICICGSRLRPGNGRFAPDPAGTLLPDGSRWGPYRGADIKSGLLADYSVELLASGFRWTEGPTWIKETSTLLFTDTIDPCIYGWNATSGVSVLATVSGGFDGANVEGYDELFEPGSNGMTLQGEWLYICQHCTRRVVRLRLAELLRLDGRRFCEAPFEVVADRTPDGRPFNAPNDIIVAPNGDVYFTDPIYGFLRKQKKGLGFAYLNAEKGEHPDQPYVDELCQRTGAGCTGVYRVRSGVVELVTKDMNRPNGLALSNDGRFLWVCNSAKEGPSWRAYFVTDTLPAPMSVVLNSSTLGEDLDPAPDRPGCSDGFRIDEQGRIWSTVPGGVVVLDASRNAVLGKILLGTITSNVEFGDSGDVFVTGLGHLWRLRKAG